MPATYKLTLHSVFSGPETEFINVFGYHDQLALPVAMSELVNHFLTDVLPDLAAVVASIMFYTRLECEQVIGGSLYIDHVIDPPVQGLRSGDFLPLFNAWGFEFRRANRGERSGAKRLGAITENDVDAGAADATIHPLLVAAAAAMGSPIQIGLVNTWFPVILERPVPPATAWGFHDLNDVLYKRVTTQNTRKR